MKKQEKIRDRTGIQLYNNASINMSNPFWCGGTDIKMIKLNEVTREEGGKACRCTTMHLHTDTQSGMVNQFKK